MIRTRTPVVVLRIVHACVIAAVLAACGGGGGGGGNSSSPAVAPPLQADPGAFQVLTPVPNAVVGGRTITATCSGSPGSNPDYHFWARRGSVNKLAVFFEGGGACWDDATCSFPFSASAQPGTPQLFNPEIGAEDGPINAAGIFDLQNPDNPVKDWSIVYVPYCTGDIHGGSKTATYTNVATGQPFTIEHRGADNFAVILRWMADNFSNPEEVLVSGSSAGAYGAMINYSKVRAVFSSAKGVLLGDAGQGVMSASFDAMRSSCWNMELDPAVWGANSASTPTSELMRVLAGHYPDDRIAQYTTTFDLAQTQFHSVMTYGLTATRHPEVCQAWTDAMVSGLNTNERRPNFSTYLAAGTTHTLLRGARTTPAGPAKDPYTENSAGVPFMQWMSQQLNAEPVSNPACTNCTTLPFTCPF